MQIVSGSLVSAAGYLLSIAVTGQEFSWTDFIIATAMGAATATIMVIGGKIVKTIKTAQAKRAANKSTLTEIDINDTDAKKQSIEEKLSSKEGLEELMKDYPEQADKWKSKIAEIQDLYDTGSAAELKSAKLKLSNLKGDIFEYATKDTLAQSGFTVETNKVAVQGESGTTYPDIVAHNNTGNTLEVFGTKIAPGETIYIECKCGQKQYLTQQLKYHIPNQLSGHANGRSFLVTTSNMSEVNDFLQLKVQGQYNTTLIPANISVDDVNKLLLNYGS